GKDDAVPDFGKGDVALSHEVVDQILGHAQVAGGLQRVHHVVDGRWIVDHDQILRVIWTSLPIIWVRRGGPRPVRLAGPGRCPLKAEISGSNPLRATTTPGDGLATPLSDISAPMAQDSDRSCCEGGKASS